MKRIVKAMINGRWKEIRTFDPSEVGSDIGAQMAANKEAKRLKGLPTVSAVCIVLEA